MRSYPTRFVILFLLVPLLLAACGDVTNTVGPAAQPTATQAASTATPVPNQQITPAPGQLPTKTSQPATSTASNTATPLPKPTNIPGTPSAISLDKPFQIKMNQSATFAENGLVITFSDVTEDSRCPNSNGNKSVACAWSGQVSAQLQLKQGSNPAETVKLTIFGGTPNKVPDTAIKKLGNYQLVLVKVDPYPIIDVRIDLADYVVTLQITDSTTQANPTATPVPNQQVTPTKTSQPATSTAKSNPATPTPFVNQNTTPVAINIGQSFQLKMNQTAYLPTNDLYITFSSVTEDSRCPDPNGNKSVNCFWAGQVVIMLQVKQGNNPPETVKLNTPGGTGNTQVAIGATSKPGNNQLQFIKVDPRRIIDVDINPADYVITLQVV